MYRRVSFHQWNTRIIRLVPYTEFTSTDLSETYVYPFTAVQLTLTSFKQAAKNSLVANDILKASCYSSQYCFTLFCSFTWRLTESVCSTNALPIAMHRQHVLYSCLRTLQYRTFAYAPILHKYNTDVTDPQSFMPASAWHSCRDAALFPNYFGQTCFNAFYFCFTFIRRSAVKRCVLSIAVLYEYMIMMKFMEIM